MSMIPWKRVHRGLAQYARTHEIHPTRVEQVMLALQALLKIAGDGSRSRQAMYRLGCALLAPKPHIFVPVCPDYSNKDGKYTYEGMGDGIPLLFNKHRPFVSQVLKIVPEAQVTILIADHEGGLPDFRVAHHVTLEEFRTRVERTRAKVKQASPKTWEVHMFTEVFPGFLTKAWDEAHVLLIDAKMRERLELDTLRRAPLYDKIGYPREGRLERTAHVAGQYVCLGHEVRSRGALVCNHTTTSLSWYGPTQVAVLHNPVVIY